MSPAPPTAAPAPVIDSQTLCAFADFRRAVLDAPHGIAPEDALVAAFRDLDPSTRASAIGALSHRLHLHATVAPPERCDDGDLDALVVAAAERVRRSGAIRSRRRADVRARCA